MSLVASEQAELVATQRIYLSALNCVIRRENHDAVFADAEEVYRYLAGIFRRGLENEDLANRLAGSGVVLRIHYTDPDAVVTVDMPEKVVETGADSGVTPNVELFMSADTGNRFWLGKVNLTMAMAKGTVRAKGPVTKLIKLIPQAKNLFPEYRAILEADKRHDLLNV